MMSDIEKLKVVFDDIGIDYFEENGNIHMEHEMFFTIFYFDNEGRCDLNWTQGINICK